MYQPIDRKRANRSGSAYVRQYTVADEVQFRGVPHEAEPLLQIDDADEDVLRQSERAEMTDQDSSRVCAHVMDTHLHAQASAFVSVMTERFATCEMEASASPRKPYVARRARSEEESLDVVKHRARMGRSAFFAREQRRWVNVVHTAWRQGDSEADLDPAPVVLDLQQVQAAVLDGDADGRRARVEAVLDEFLERRRGPVYNLHIRRVNVLESPRSAQTHLARGDAVDGYLAEATDGLRLLRLVPVARRTRRHGEQDEMCVVQTRASAWVCGRTEGLCT